MSLISNFLFSASFYVVWYFHYLKLSGTHDDTVDKQYKICCTLTINFKSQEDNRTVYSFNCDKCYHALISNYYICWFFFNIDQNWWMIKFNNHRVYKGKSLIWSCHTCSEFTGTYEHAKHGFQDRAVVWNSTSMFPAFYSWW